MNPLVDRLRHEASQTYPSESGRLLYEAANELEGAHEVIRVMSQYGYQALTDEQVLFINHFLHATVIGGRE